MAERVTCQAGELAVAALAGFGIDTIFTLNGGHIWPLYDGARTHGMRIIDTRHEQSATWAAEAWAKLTRGPGVAVLTAGPGVTNGVSAITSAYFNGAPLVVIGGRAPQSQWGSGSLQELDHVPIIAPVTKTASTVIDPADTTKAIQSAVLAALAPHRGPVFVDIPVDVLFASADAEVPDPGHPPDIDPDPEEIARAAAMIADASRPAVIAGSDVYWAGAWDALARAVEHLRVPCFANGMGRGCLSADHELSFNRTRGLLKSEADVVVVVGTPLDFRLGFGRYGDARVIHITDHPQGRAMHVPAAVAPSGNLGLILEGLAAWTGDRVDHEPWITRLRDSERAAAWAERDLLEAANEPIKPTTRLRRAETEVGPRRDRHLRRRRLRLIRGQAHRGLQPRDLAGYWTLWVSGKRPRIRHRRPAGPPLRPGRNRLGRWSGGVLAHGGGHHGPSPAARRTGRRQQRDLGTREASSPRHLRLGRSLRPPTTVSL